MRDFTDLIFAVKKAALDAVEARKPVSVVCATVMSTDPFLISIDQKLTLTDTYLIYTEETANINWMNGDGIILLRVQGGQSYLVLGKAVYDRNDTHSE